MSKLAEDGITLTLRDGGDGSELFDASIRVRDVMYSPAVLNVTLPGVFNVELEGVPPGKIHEYFDAVVAESKKTVEPWLTVTSETGAAIAPDGGAVTTVSRSTQPAFDGTPLAS